MAAECHKIGSNRMFKHTFKLLVVVGKESLLKRNTPWRYIIEKSKDKNEKIYGYKKVDQFVTEVSGLFKSMLKEFMD